MKYLTLLLCTISAWNAIAQNPSTIIAKFEAPFNNALNLIPYSEILYEENSTDERSSKYIFRTNAVSADICSDVVYKLGDEANPWDQLHVDEIINYSCGIIINAKENDPIILKSFNARSPMSKLSGLSTFLIQNEAMNTDYKKESKMTHSLEIDRASIEKIFPELIHHGENGTKGTYPLKFIPIIISALQEQHELSQSYEAQLIKQQNQIDGLTAEITEIRKLIKK